ncbi:hypothetical protein KUA24_8 [Vibrio phage HNL01]|nr:hypothetical protein KUA24_8 [Vibrio phage HNL01]
MKTSNQTSKDFNENLNKIDAKLDKSLALSLKALKVVGVFFLFILAISFIGGGKNTQTAPTAEEVQAAEYDNMLMQVAYKRVKRAGLTCNTVEEYTVRDKFQTFLACDGYTTTYKVKMVNGVIEINGVKYFNL